MPVPPHPQRAVLLCDSRHLYRSHEMADRPAVNVKEITCMNNGADACRYRIPEKVPRRFLRLEGVSLNAPQKGAFLFYPLKFLSCSGIFLW